MDYSHRLAISYYKNIAVINEPHQVYLAQHTQTGKIYVKKILDVYNASIFEALQAEHVVGTPQIIDFIEEDNKLILIEEYVPGCSLLEKIESHTLTPSDILSYMMDLCNILEHLHYHKPPIIHRDIKPSNIIITNHNRVMLLDFNAAKYHSANSGEDTVLLGTHGYAAPEQYGFGSSTPQTDIYSLGVLLKEMAGSINYNAPMLRVIIDKCTQMKPSERYMNIKELREDIVALGNNPLRTVRRPKQNIFTLPGFRSHTPWKMLLAIIGYSMIFAVSSSMESSSTYGGALILERIITFLVMLFWVAGCTNYMNVQSLMPLCKSKDAIVRYIGILILNVGVSTFLLVIMALIEKYVFLL